MSIFKLIKHDLNEAYRWWNSIIVCTNVFSAQNRFFVICLVLLEAFALSQHLNCNIESIHVCSFHVHDAWNHCGRNMSKTNNCQVFLSGAGSFKYNLWWWHPARRTMPDLSYPFSDVEKQEILNRLTLSMTLPPDRFFRSATALLYTTAFRSRFLEAP